MNTCTKFYFRYLWIYRFPVSAMQHPHVVHKGRASNNKVDRKKVCSQYKFVNDQYVSEYLQSYMVQQKIS